MSIKLNHTIVYSKDENVSAKFLAEILGLDAPTRFGIFLEVRLDNDVTLDFATTDGDIVEEHYAFLVGEKEFDEIFGRIREGGIQFWADPFHNRAGEINTSDGGRGLYFDNPDQHNLEILTKPYGSGT
jgi:hypothetical protein